MQELQDPASLVETELDLDLVELLERVREEVHAARVLGSGYHRQKEGC